LQPYDLLRHDRLMLSKDAALRLSRSLATGAGTAKEATETAAATPGTHEDKPVQAAPAAEGSQARKRKNAKGEAPAKPRTPRAPKTKE
jgi:hypothetical protein